MKYSIILLFILIGCEAPRQKRGSSSNNINPLLGTLYDFDRDSGDGDSSNDGDGDSSDDQADNDTDTDSGSSEVSHCNFSESVSGTYRYGSSEFGGYNVCQSQTERGTIYLQFKYPFNGRVAFVPLRISGSDSMFIGRPTYVDFVKGSPSINKITIINDTTKISGRESYTMNGFMMMRDDRKYTFPSPFPSYQSYYPLDAYLYCMCWKEATDPKCQPYNLSWCSAYAQENKYDFVSF